MTLSVIKVASGGLAVSQAPAPYGYPCVLSTNGFGLAVTVVASGGRPISDATPGGGIFAGVNLSSATFTVGNVQGTAIGTFSVTGGSGTYTYTLSDSAGSKAQVAGANGVNLQVGSAVATVGSFSITVTTTGGTPNFTQSFLITVLPIAPSNAGIPTISGTPAFGNTLTSSTGSWISNPISTYTYQWKRSGVAISGATASTYLLGLFDIGATMTVTVTATNPGGSASATSAATTTVAGLAPANSGGANAPVLSGTATDGQILTVTDGTWTGAPAPTFSYQWKRGGVTNIGTNSSSYTIVTADVGSTIRCDVTGTNVAGNATAQSNSSATVTSGGPPPTSGPTYFVYFF